MSFNRMILDKCLKTVTNVNSKAQCVLNFVIMGGWYPFKLMVLFILQQNYLDGLSVVVCLKQ